MVVSMTIVQIQAVCFASKNFGDVETEWTIAGLQWSDWERTPRPPLIQAAAYR
jgi:hypothetical protein